MPGYYPLLVDLSGRRCVIIGGGNVAERKVRGLLDSGADDVIVVAPATTQGLSTRCGRVYSTAEKEIPRRGFNRRFSCVCSYG